MTPKNPAADLNPDTVLQRAPSLTLELGPNANARVGDRRVPVGPNILPILQAFEQPVAFGIAVKSLSEKITGAQAWIELVSTITSLYKTGVLVGEGAARKPVVGAGWTAPMIHIAMLDEKELAKYAFTADATKAWKEWYGIDFSPVLTSTLNKSMTFNIQPHATRDWPQLSSPIVLADLDLSGTKPPLVNESAELIIETPGLLGGLLVYFELDVAPGERISTAPAEAGEMCSWSARVWTSGTQQPASRGDRIKVDYKYRVDSSQTRIEMTLQNSGSSSS